MGEQASNIQLGCGLIRIGREWGYKKANIPTSAEAQVFLNEAINLGVQFFDTAPSYGSSEQRLGEFLQALPNDKRHTLTIATKCGEHWNANKHEAFVDHSYEALVRSIDNSLALLGAIDILQIHKATSSVLQSDEVLSALEYAKTRGIKHFGASVSDPETAEFVGKSDEISAIQLPFNSERVEMNNVIQKLKAAGKFLIINRPFNMGEIIDEGQNELLKQQRLLGAYAFIIKENFSGVILTGTSSGAHLKENLIAFESACTNNQQS